MTYSSHCLDEILSLCVAARASDIHVASGVSPRYRRDGKLTPIAQFPDVYGNDELLETLSSLMSVEQKAIYDREHAVDMSYRFSGSGRFRINIYRTYDGIAAAFRPIPTAAASFAELGVPAVAAEFVRALRGLVLVTGAAGSGKTTTLAAMVDAINTGRDCHILTLEDPIEFLHASRRALVTQRDLGAGTRSFGEALRYVAREDPDVILVGELRDLETIQVAVAAAEAGQLVLAAMSTRGVAASINTIVDAFPAHQQSRVMGQLASVLTGVISQTLIPRGHGSGRVLATEVMVQTPTLQNLIREGHTEQLYSVLQTGSAFGMHTMDQSMGSLVESGRVSLRDVRPLLDDPHALDNIQVHGSDLSPEEWFESDVASVGHAARVSRENVVPDRAPHVPRFVPLAPPSVPSQSGALPTVTRADAAAALASTSTSTSSTFAVGQPVSAVPTHTAPVPTITRQLPVVLPVSATGHGALPQGIPLLPSVTALPGSKPRPPL